MRVVDARVDDGDDVRRRARRDVPRRHGVDVGAGNTREEVDQLTDVLESPELAEVLIVGLGADADDEVRLGVLDVGAVPQPCQQRRRVQRAGA